MTNREYILSLNDRQLAILLLHYDIVLLCYQETRAKRRDNTSYLLLTQIFLDDKYQPEYYEYLF